MASSIKVKFDLITSGVTNKLKDIGTRIDRFSKKAVANLNKVVKAAGAAMVAGFAAGARGALNYAKEIENLSNVANTSVENFQKLAHGAKTVGIEKEKLADIYKDMTDRVGDYLETGGGPMADWFENIAPKIGVTADEFRNLSGPEALQKYYDGLEKANVGQEQMTFYMEAVASDATALIPLLANGGLKFQQLGNDAVAGGLVMSDATQKNLKKAQDAIDAFKVKAIIKVGEIIGDGGGGLKKLGAGFMLLMANVGDWLINSFLAAAQALTGLLVASVVTMGQKMVQMFEKAALHLQLALGPVIANIAKAFNINIDIDVEGIKAKLAALDSQTTSFADNFEQITGTLGHWNINLEESKQHWRDIYNIEGDAKTTLDEINKIKKGGVTTDSQAKDLADQKKQLLDKQLQLEIQIEGKNHDVKASLTQQIAEHERIIYLMEKYDIPLDQALQIIKKQNDDIKNQQYLWEAIERAKAAGDERAVTYWTNILNLEGQAIALMDKLGISYSDAYDIAYDQYVLRTGDLDLNGQIDLVEKKKHEKLKKQLAIQQKKKELSEKEQSILVRKLIPNYKEVRKQAEAQFKALQSSKMINEQIAPILPKQRQEYEKIPPKIGDINYELEKSVQHTGAVLGNTTGIPAAEDAAKAAIDKTNASRKEAVNLANALKNAGGNQDMNINVTHSIVTDLNNTLVPHLQTHTTLLTSIDKKLSC